MPTLPLTLWALVATAKVSTVVVYPDRAQVTRVETVTCTGPTSVRFESLPPAAAPESFRAHAAGATVEGLVSEETSRATAYGPERAKLEARRVALAREQSVLEGAAERAKDLEKLAQGFTEVAVDRVTRELTGPKPDTRAWSAAFDSALAVRLRAVAEEQETAVKLTDVQRRLVDVDAELARVVDASERTERQVEVRLSCPRGTQAKVELTYLVGGAAWEPAYEARADETSDTVELTTLATVRQSTGEDWAGARLVLSTALPRQDATPPELKPLYVFAWEREKERKVLVRRDEQQRHADAGAAVGAVASQGLRAAAQGLSVQLEVQEAARVPGDGTGVRVRVARTQLQAAFTWRAVPKLYPVVFRVGRVSNAAPFPLLPGPVDLYRGTGYLGRQPLERVAQGAPFELTFGVEEGLRVERRVVEELQKDPGLFNDKRRFRYAYRFELTNLRPRAEEVELSEHFPVSELEDVKVELEPKTTTPGHTVQPADGIATWKVKLAPGEKRAVDFAFHVDAPSSYDTGGL